MKALNFHLNAKREYNFPLRDARMQWATVLSGERPCLTFSRAPFEATLANSVLTGPGQSAVTFIPRGFNSAARATVKLRTYDLHAPYTAKLPSGRYDARLAVLMRREPFFM